MTGEKPSLEGFVELYSATLKKAEGRLRLFVKEPTPRNLHAVRASARRIGALWSLLPSRLKGSGSAKEYRKALRRVQKVASEVGDCDTMIGLMEGLPRRERPLRLIRSLGRRRARLEGNAKESARRLLAQSPPKLESGDLRPSKLRRRFHKKVERYLGNALEELQQGTSDPQSVEDLHKARKSFREVRYLLRLTEQSEDGNDSLATLIDLQDSLGEIRDLDVLIGLLRKNSAVIPLSQVEKAEAKRADLYQSLVKSLPSALRTLRAIGE